MAVESLIGLATLAVIMLLVVWCADKHRSEYIGKPLIFLYFPWVDGHEAGVALLTHALSIISAKRHSHYHALLRSGAYQIPGRFIHLASEQNLIALLPCFCSRTQSRILIVRC